MKFVPLFRIYRCLCPHHYVILSTILCYIAEANFDNDRSHCQQNIEFTVNCLLLADRNVE
jgi:hypothetical protein